MRFQFTTTFADTIYLNETQTYNYVPGIPAYGNNTGADYNDVLQYCAYAQKMNLTWGNQHNDLVFALGNITMSGSIPNTTSSSFSVDSAWALYGFYYANNSWVPSSIRSRWNITAAYNQFDSAVNYSVASSTPKGMPMWVYSDGTGASYFDRFYDEDAECIEDYLLFYNLLNVSDALAKAQYWWGYLVDTHWNPLDVSSGNQSLTYFRYSEVWSAGDPYEFEMSGGEFLKITSILKYYVPNLTNYSYEQLSMASKQ
jgi:hypothetical protein